MPLTSVISTRANVLRISCHEGILAVIHRKQAGVQVEVAYCILKLEPRSGRSCFYVYLESGKKNFDCKAHNDPSMIWMEFLIIGVTCLRMVIAVKISLFVTRGYLHLTIKSVGGIYKRETRLYLVIFCLVFPITFHECC